MGKRERAPLVSARFKSRPNRFVVSAELDNGRRARAHLADPGRLHELLVRDVELKLRPCSGQSGRKTAFTVALVRALEKPRVWVSLDTTLPNRLAGRLLSRGEVHGVGPGWHARREVRRGASRFDFVLERGGDEMVVEVKSVTLVENGIARFPDAPTARGARHVRELRELAGRGGRAAILFVVQRSDARAVTANPGTDPIFARELALARETGVLVRAVQFHFTAGGVALYRGSLPVRT